MVLVVLPPEVVVIVVVVYVDADVVVVTVEKMLVTCPPTAPAASASRVPKVFKMADWLWTDRESKLSKWLLPESVC